MRNEKAISDALDLGLSRIIVGTSACENPSWVRELIKKFGPDRIVVGIDAKDGTVATKGWVEISKLSALDFAKEMQSQGARWIIHTDVATDGAMKADRISPHRQKWQKPPQNVKIICIRRSICTEEDVSPSLRELAKKYENLEGIIIGKALYEKTVRLDHLISLV